MKLRRLLSEHGDGNIGRIAAATVGGGLLGASIVATANFATADSGGGSVILSLAFLSALAVMYLLNQWSAREMVTVYEAVQRSLRARLADALRGASLRTIETLEEERGRALDDLTHLSTTTVQLVMLVQHVAFLGAVTIIIAQISLRALVIWLVTCAIIARFIVPGMRRLRALRGQQSARGGGLHAGIEELLDGFKQIKLDPVAGDDIVEDVLTRSAALHTGYTEAAAESDRVVLTGNVLFFVFGFGLAVFAPPGTIGLGPDIAYELVILLALSLGPLFGALQSLPIVGQAEASAASLLETFDRLSATRDERFGNSGSGFDRIRLDALTFQYETGFTVGPIDLELRRGQLIFVTGGNGSGKTTLMKMLMGLYPTRGHVRWDGKVVGRARHAGYRGLFSAIFGGQFLFDRLYGLDVSPERARSLLTRFGIDHIVDFDGRGFRHGGLSRGQHMRLAMVVALLEDRPICVFDEWTANQDPETTWMYYETLLPELVAAGRTVIAVSHDDRFFDRADHLVRLEDGKVVIDQRAGSLEET